MYCPMRTKRHACRLLVLLSVALLTMHAGCGNQPQLALDDIDEVLLGQPGTGDVNRRPATAAEVTCLVEYYAEA